MNTSYLKNKVAGPFTGLWNCNDTFGPSSRLGHRWGVEQRGWGGVGQGQPAQGIYPGSLSGPKHPKWKKDRMVEEVHFYLSDALEQLHGAKIERILQKCYRPQWQAWKGNLNPAETLKPWELACQGPPITQPSTYFVHSFPLVPGSHFEESNGRTIDSA